MPAQGMRAHADPLESCEADQHAQAAGPIDGDPEEMTDIFVARQPIFDRKTQVIGYELLFRDGQANHANVVNASAATAAVVLNSFTEIGLKRMVGARSAWIKAPQQFIDDGLTQLLPQRAVVELLPGLEITSELLDAISALKQHGHRIALDRFTYTLDSDPLLRLIDVVKLDLIDLGRERFDTEIHHLRRYPVALLASRVENQKDHAYCRQAGCELFQGYFFCRPEIMQERRIDANRLAVLDLLATLQDPTIDLTTLQRTIATDLGLSVRLLRYINSAFFGLRQPVRSIGQALALLGTDHLRRWAALTLFASSSHKPTELTITALIRARFCELAAPHYPHTNPNELFTVGLFSLIDALLDTPIEDAVKQVPLAQDLRDAIAKHTGAPGQLLTCLTALETADFDAAERILPSAGPIYMSAIQWADETTGALIAG